MDHCVNYTALQRFRAIDILGHFAIVSMSSRHADTRFGRYFVSASSSTNLLHKQCKRQSGQQSAPGWCIQNELLSSQAHQHGALSGGQHAKEEDIGAHSPAPRIVLEIVTM